MADASPRALPTLTRLAGGEMSGRVQALDWSTTPLGPMATWSPSLRLAVDMILATNFPMALRWGPELCLIYNDAYAPALHERHPGALGMAFAGHSAEVQASLRTVHDDILSGASGGYAFEDLPLRVRRDGDGEPRLARFRVSYSPLPDATAANGIGGVLVTAVEITETSVIEKALERQQETLRLAVDAADVGVWETDLETGQVTWSDRCYAMFGIPVGTPLTLDDFFAHVHPADLAHAREAVERSLDPEVRADHALELRVIGRDDGVERWLSIRGEVLFSPEGRPQRFLGAVVNITDRKRAELHLRLLVNELNHRVKNSLATIQAIAAQSFNGSRSLPEAQEAFTNRIVALSEAHDLLTRENWEGAELHDIASRLVTLHGGPVRFGLSGPAIRLSPRAALSLSMALHELATNAVKYGALSVPEGRVAIAWDLAQGSGAQRLDLSWAEHDGPPVTPPTRRGFGSRLIERGLAAELSGEASIRFEPEGVVCRIRALLDA
jgi:PAS domain S-box-containing protein